MRKRLLLVIAVALLIVAAVAMFVMKQVPKAEPEIALDTSDVVVGVDADANGVRDDIDAYIAGLPDKAGQKQSLLQGARALNDMFAVDFDNKEAVQTAGDHLVRAVRCMNATYGDFDLPGTRMRSLEKYTFNTSGRSAAYARFNDASGSYSFHVSAGPQCDF